MLDDKYTAMLSGPQPVQHLSWPKMQLWDWNPVGVFEGISGAKHAVHEQGYTLVHGWPRPTKIEGELAYIVMTFVFDPAIKGTRLCLILPTRWFSESLEAKS